MCQSQILLTQFGCEVGHLHDVAQIEQSEEGVRIHFALGESRLLPQATIAAINVWENQVRIALKE